MRTLQEHLDDLDRMIDNGASPKHEIRSQIAFVAREVAALEADYTSLVQAHAESQDAATRAITELDSQVSKIKTNDKRVLDEWLAQRSKQQAEFRKRHTLNYGA